MHNNNNYIKYSVFVLVSCFLPAERTACVAHFNISSKWHKQQYEQNNRIIKTKSIQNMIDILAVLVSFSFFFGAPIGRGEREMIICCACACSFVSPFTPKKKLLFLLFDWFPKHYRNWSLQRIWMQTRDTCSITGTYIIHFPRRIWINLFTSASHVVKMHGIRSEIDLTRFRLWFSAWCTTYTVRTPM